MPTDACSGRNLTWQYLHHHHLPALYASCPHAAAIVASHGCKNGTCRPSSYDMEFERYTWYDWDGLGDPTGGVGIVKGNKLDIPAGRWGWHRRPWGRDDVRDGWKQGGAVAVVGKRGLLGLVGLVPVTVGVGVGVGDGGDGVAGTGVSTSGASACLCLLLLACLVLLCAHFSQRVARRSRKKVQDFAGQGDGSVMERGDVESTEKKVEAGREKEES
ncbi:hypothetical protein MBM_04564 [Drepanopeziza brunnea f. sp. 'multigermtubi' MB_m1]|uniref:Uncharacterized protein n=1 Tax=Marssonina brunnea f. sp. multigermtubi (strain MB_m1) TaxID=1072389 RepID=K1WWS0_MARBU|nr:uncharacterized protein MBM_04564 [Drepanopeziza brunnea f. sp. 'multigermtubi' MB_m1]EKD16987.1 hypothetical protein MBM_04564 [Drepanopeziza brunnea f. sp. 'multigermtubi' MB_m1]